MEILSSRGFSEYIKTIAVFLILLSFVRIITPHKKYNYYIELIMGFIMISVVISPAAKMLQTAPKPLDVPLSALNYKINAYEIKNEAYIRSGQNKMILDTYTEELKRQVKNLVLSGGGFVFCDAEFVIGGEDENFGDILSVRVLLSEKEADGVQDQASEGNSFIRVDGVKVRLPNSVLSKDAPDAGDEISALKNSVSSFYNLSPDNIYITVRKN